MKTKLLSLFVALLATTALFAYDCEVDGIYYNLNTTEMTAEVTFRDQYSALYIGSVVIPSSINYQSQTYTVTTIGKEAFYNCSGLTSIDIPNSVITIGMNAFTRCDGLTSVTIPNSVTTIEYRAFFCCYGLTSITISHSVTIIGENAFSGCYGLTSVTIPNSVTTIGYGAFDGCSSLISIDIPNSVTTIAEYAFSGCSGLTSIDIPYSITTIGSYAFVVCSSLTDISVAWTSREQLPIMGDGVFNGINKDSPSGATLHVPEGTKSIYETADIWKEFEIIAEEGTRLIETLENKQQKTDIKVICNGQLIIDHNGQHYSAMGERIK